MAAVCILFTAALTGCSTPPKSESLTMNGMYFDTVVQIEAWGASQEIMDHCRQMCEEYEQILSATIDTSEISEINHAKGQPVTVSDETVELIVKGAPRYTEFMQLPRGVRGLNVAGTGIDVEILRRCRASKWLRGKLQYLISLIISLIKFKNYDLTVRVNGREVRYKTLIACVGNGFRFGGGIRMCPQAVLGDNLLDFVAVDNVKKSRILPAFIKLMQGRILEEKFSRFERCDHIEIFSERPLTVQVDGELYDDLPFVADVVRDTLRMYRG